jgi:hypothetical protein
MPRGTKTGGGNSTVTLNPIDIPLPPGTHGGQRSETKLIVLHDTEGHNTPGVGDLHTLGDVLRGEGLSVHAGNDAEGNCARYLPDDTEGYHVAAYNSIAVGIEQIGFSTQGSWPPAQIENTAKWVAYWAGKYGIPIRFSTTHGICQHKDLGAAGGNHNDCGPAYPFDQVLQKAASFLGTVVQSPDGTGDRSNTSGEASGVSGSAGPSAAEVASISKATAFSAYLDLPGVFDSLESISLKGSKSLMNDQSLFPFIEQLCRASLRHFQSMPNGHFYAFYPDYFGGLSHRTPYWEIHDIEIMDLTMDISDDSLATHVYVVGDIAQFDHQVTIADKVQSGGTVTIFDAFLADFINGLPPRQVKARNDHPGDPPGEGGHTREQNDKPDDNLDTPTLPYQKALAFLQKYGARPYYEEVPMVRSPYYELFLAYQTFCLLWARQFVSQLRLTFMPELFPGGIIALPDHGLQFYVEEVEHTFDYEGGFTTQAVVSAPAGLQGAGRDAVSVGLIRDFALNNNELVVKPFDHSISES